MNSYDYPKTDNTIALAPYIADQEARKLSPEDYEQYNEWVISLESVINRKENNEKKIL